ncbi:MAG: type II toxin-antitoxin system Phd/YefM family antitoxin [Acidithiobacillus ferriphilus]
MMLSINLKDAKARFSSVVDEVVNGELVTITRHGKPVAVLVSVEMAEAGRKAVASKRSSLVDHLKTFPGDLTLGRNPSPSRDLES